MSAATLLTPDLLAGLAAVVGEDGLSTAEADLFAGARDCWTRETIRAASGRASFPPEVVVWPRTTDQVARVVALCRQSRLPLVVYGGGSGVCGAAIPVRGGLMLDMKRMDRLLDISDRSLLATVEAGMIGQDFEEALNRAGLTFGHFPSSMYCATVGGFVATRSSGQLSTRYGNIEDLVAGLEVVLPDGRVWESHLAPRSAAGPDFKQLMIGAEGTLGVITRCVFRVRPLPAARLFRAYHFEDVAPALDAVRLILRRGLKPAAVRLYDRLDTRVTSLDKRLPPAGATARPEAVGAAPDLPGDAGGPSPDHRGAPPAAPGKFAQFVAGHFPGLGEHLVALGLCGAPLLNKLVDLLGGRCLLILTFEGEPGPAGAEEALARDLCLSGGATDLGVEPARRWWARRYHVSYKLSPVFEQGAFAETLEVAATWDRVGDLYRRVRAAIGRRAMVMAHFSHAYGDGCSIYFTFAAAGATPRAAEALYERIVRDALDAATAAGGTFAHHHGVGLAKRAFLAGALGPALDIWRALKRALDPDDLMNPGKLPPSPSY
ncbi:MAG: FAD-binding oxidoreductase [Planctomycetes bacterium]|nr:FAD-binding oxidoreductase [Planctomycetota bacterium]